MGRTIQISTGSTFWHSSSFPFLCYFWSTNLCMLVSGVFSQAILRLLFPLIWGGGGGEVIFLGRSPGITVGVLPSIKLFHTSFTTGRRLKEETLTEFKRSLLALNLTPCNPKIWFSNEIRWRETRCWERIPHQHSAAFHFLLPIS